MPEVTATDMMRARTVENQTRLVREHLEGMQRDAHGLEFGPWKIEVDELWKSIFGQINRMSPAPQQRSLQSIRELWTSYVTHYSVIAV